MHVLRANSKEKSCERLSKTVMNYPTEEDGACQRATRITMVILWPIRTGILELAQQVSTRRERCYPETWAGHHEMPCSLGTWVVCLTYQMDGRVVAYHVSDGYGEPGFGSGEGA